ncbi:MAG TPA: hypothetical protein VFZ21_13915 [Gemmatimonadaceae bacterium]|nr:hypothetical protein [Gemmatimonadaceae bacterium]
MRTRDHVDLWLHGFAVLQVDSTRVPFFRRGYRDSVLARRQRANVATLIDANRERLAERFIAFPNLVSAQFIPLYFGTWEETRQSAEMFLRAEGDERAAGDLRSQQIIRLFAGYFPTYPDREWLRLFVQAVEDERVKFFQQYWEEQQRQRSAARATVDSLWRDRYRQRFARFLNNSGADRGTIVLSLPLDGEGRTLDLGQRTRVVAVNFPDDPDQAPEALYTFAHEVVSSVTSIAIDDNLSPAEKRAGGAVRYASAALVRGGLMLLERAAPELADGYARYYLSAARVPHSTGNAKTALAAAFPLPDSIRDAIQRQIDIVLGGI